MVWFLKGLGKDGLREKIVVRVVANKLNDWMEVYHMGKSWKTTAFGLLGAVAAYLTTVTDPTWMALVGKVLGALAVAGMGLAARDNGVSSEDVGIKPK